MEYIRVSILSFLNFYVHGVWRTLSRVCMSFFIIWSVMKRGFVRGEGEKKVITKCKLPIWMAMTTLWLRLWAGWLDTSWL